MSLSILRSIIALLPTGSKGFGIFSVKGRKRSPFPPAIRTASIGKIECISLRLYILTR